MDVDVESALGRRMREGEGTVIGGSRRRLRRSGSGSGRG